MGMATGDYSTVSFHKHIDPWFTVSQAAAILGIPKSQVKKRYPFIVVDGVRLFHQDDIGYTPKTGAM